MDTFASPALAGTLVCEFELAGVVEGKKASHLRIAEKSDGTRFVHAYTPSQTRKYESRVGQEAALAMRGRPPVEGAVRLEVTAYLAVPASWSRKKRDAALSGALLPTAKPDWDNIGKTMDGVKQIVWVDDKQVAEAVVRKVYDERPRLHVKVTAL